MKNTPRYFLTLLFIVSLTNSYCYSQNPYFDSSCNAGGEIWVCGNSQVLQAHSDFDDNCSDWNYTECTILKVVVDYCSPNMSRTRIFEEGGPNCPLNHF